MNNNMVCNTKVEVPSTKEMNDENYLNAILEATKNMTNNYSIALNEASNETLYQELFQIFKETKDMQRELYELAFRKGWYKLERAEMQKIMQKRSELEGKLSELAD